MDPVLEAACATDEKLFCAKVLPGKGRMHECLREHYDDLQPDCRREEFAAEVAAAGDIMLQPYVLDQCRKEISTVCGTVVETGGDEGSGDGVYECMKDAALDRSSDMGSGCRVAMLKVSTFEDPVTKGHTNVLF